MNCTVTTGINNDHTFRLCGEPAVTSFKSASGTTFYECVKHTPTRARREVGDSVVVEAYGCTYVARIVRVSPTGKVFAEFTTGKGTRKMVEV